MAGEDPAYLAWVRTIPCCITGHPHMGRIEAHHAGRDRGVGQKAPDDTAVPLCLKHHRERHGLTGAFKGMCKAELRAWAERAIEETHARYVELALSSSAEIPW